MSEPKRWVDDPQVPDSIQELLRAGVKPPPIPPGIDAALVAATKTLLTQAGAQALGSGVASKSAAQALGSGVASKSAAAPAAFAHWLGLKTIGTMVVAGGATFAVWMGYQAALGFGEPSSPQLTAQQGHGPGPVAPAPNPPSRVAPAADPENPGVDARENPGVDALENPEAAVGDSHAVDARDSARPEVQPQTARGVRGQVHPASPASSAAPAVRENSSSASDSPPAPTGEVARRASFGSETIAHEAALLLNAREQLASDPGQALAIASEHHRLYPRGQLGADRDFIIVDALMRLGRSEEAEARAKPLIAAAPNGIYAQRLRRLLGEAGEP